MKVENNESPYRTFNIEVVTSEIINNPDLVNQFNEMSNRIVNRVGGSVTQWYFDSLLLALKALVCLHEASKDNLISHRLNGDQDCIMEYGLFVTDENFKQSR